MDTKELQYITLNNSCSLWKLIKYSTPQGSILGCVLFNTFLRDLFFKINNFHVVSFAVGSTLHTHWKTST